MSNTEIPEKTKEDIIWEYEPNREYSSYFRESDIEKMMQAYAEQESKKPNEFIRDIAKLLGEDGLGFDGISWTVDDFKNAIDQEKRKEAIAFAEWSCKNLWTTNGGMWYPYRDDDNPITGDELYDLFIQSLPKV